MTRKTVPVALIIERANHFLAESEDAQQDERYGVAGLLEAVLLDVGAYAGFSFLPAAGVTNGVDGFDALDTSRRQYNVHHKARA